MSRCRLPVPRSARACACLLLLAAGCAGGPEPASPPEPRAPVAEPDSAVVESPPEPEPRPEPEPEETKEPPAEAAPPPEPEAEGAAMRGTPPLAGWGRAADAILPRRRIVAFYGNPLSRRMGILGELPPAEMLALLDREVRAWELADPGTRVTPALHLIAVMATADPGPDSLFRLRQPERVIEQVLEWAALRDAIVFLDIQPGRSRVEAELPRLEKWLRRPNVHLALDPEWAVRAPRLPGQVIGSMRAEDVNVAIRFLARIVQENQLPPKVLVVHRFTEGMLRDPEGIGSDPRVQVVLNMDGWGPPQTKRASYRSYVAQAPVELKGFKLFYKNDRRGGSRLMTPAEVLTLRPAPIYIQYQ